VSHRLGRGIASAVLVLLAAVPGFAADMSVGLAGGYEGGAGARVSGTADGFAKGFPLAAEIAFGFVVRDPGNAADARKVFINDNTNGSPESYGADVLGRLDFWYDTRWIREGHLSLGGGVRFSNFWAHFKYVGGNEEFDVTTNQWGAGFGAKAAFSMAAKLDLVIIATLDYYFDASMEAHSRVYSPNGNNVDPRAGYTYTDADNAINQPKLQPAVVIGLAYHL